MVFHNYTIPSPYNHQRLNWIPLMVSINSDVSDVMVIYIQQEHQPVVSSCPAGTAGWNCCHPVASQLEPSSRKCPSPCCSAGTSTGGVRLELSISLLSSRNFGVQHKHDVVRRLGGFRLFPRVDVVRILE